MKVKQGYAYHIKNQFFIDVNDKSLMVNKGKNNYRPHYYTVRDTNNKDIYWMIPISSKVKKYKNIIKQKQKEYGQCNTIFIGIFAGTDKAFLIQNAFPITKEYIHHIHTVKGNPITIQKQLQKTLEQNLKTLINIHMQGTKVFYADVEKIYPYLEQKLNNQQK